MAVESLGSGHQAFGQFLSRNGLDRREVGLKLPCGVILPCCRHDLCACVHVLLQVVSCVLGLGCPVVDVSASVFCRDLPPLCHRFSAKCGMIWRQILSTWRQNWCVHQRGTEHAPTVECACTGGRKCVHQRGKKRKPLDLTTLLPGLPALNSKSPPALWGQAPRNPCKIGLSWGLAPQGALRSPRRRCVSATVGIVKTPCKILL